MLNWTIERLSLYLKFNWKISRNATDNKVNFYIKVQSGGVTGIGEVAPNVRYNESSEKILSEFGIILNNELPIVKDLDALQKLMGQFKICNSLRFGIESAYIDWYCKKNKIAIHSFLGVDKPDKIETAFTVPIMDIGRLGDFFLKNDLHRFKYIKVKIDAESGYETIKEIDNITDQPLMIDANEAWKNVDDLLKFIEKIKAYNIVFLEQPMPSYMDDEYYYLKMHSPLTLMADESVTNKPDFVKIKRQFDGINMKLMKAGGLENAMKIIREAKMFQLKTMVGCMVETTVGISFGAYFAGITDFVDLDSFLYIENEPSKVLKEEKGVLSFVN